MVDGALRLEQLCLKQGNFELKDICLSLEKNDYAVLMGRTGAGKTSLLEAICGLRSPVAGKIVLAGRDVTRLAPFDRRIGYVPQDSVLFPGMSVREQLGFGLHVQFARTSLQRQRVDEIAERLFISHLLDRQIEFLSGGEKQRVALGRALVIDPMLLCLDEPLSALDAATKSDMLELLKQVRQDQTIPILHVTHDETEAVRLNARALRLNDGKLLENI